MKLKKITVKNFRSVEEQSLEIKEIGGSYTYALIGVNESGKSSFLEAGAGTSTIEESVDLTDELLPKILDKK